MSKEQWCEIFNQVIYDARDDDEAVRITEELMISGETYDSYYRRTQVGYTHYWRQRGDVSEEDWKRIVSLFNDLRYDSNCPALDIDGDDPVEVSDEVISFNGVEDESCETFYLTRCERELSEWEKDSDGAFNFCKTARREYDDLVVAMLAIIGCLHPDIFEISSDGDFSEIEDAIKWADRATGLQLYVFWKLKWEE